MVGFSCYLLRQLRAFVNSVGLLEIYSKIIKGMVFEAIEWVMGPWLYRLTLSGVLGAAAEEHSLEEPQCCFFCTEWGIGKAGHGRHRNSETELGENLAHFMIT